MTDMNRLTNHENNEEKLKDIFSEEIREKLASEDSGKPSLEDFRKAVAKDKKTRRKKHTAIAACFVAALLIGYFALDMQASDVDADKNPKEVIQTEDGVIIEDGGYGTNVGEDNVIVITEWNDIDEIKKAFSELPIPSYIPNEYAFKTLKVELFNTGDIQAEYIFSDTGNRTMEIEALIMGGGIMSTEVEDVSKKLNSKYGDIYIQGESNKRATILIDDGIMLYLWGDIQEDILVKIINGITI